jgi:tetratricopeptide (TPR) repeat protein
MKEDVNTILNYIDTQCIKEIFRLRELLFSLSASQPNELSQAINNLSTTIKHVNAHDIQQMGTYYLFLGCIYYEQDKYQTAFHCLQIAVNEIWGVQVNKALTHWLLGLCYRNTNQYLKACQELEEAIELLATNTSVNTLSTNSQSQKRQEILKIIQAEFEQFQNDPLFPTEPPVPDQSTDSAPKEKSTVNENGTSRTKPQEDNATSTPVSEIQTGKNIPWREKNHLEGYILFQSLPIYGQVVAASKSGKPEIGLHEIGFAEAQTIILDMVPHKVFPIKWTSNQIKIALNDKKWGWVKIHGNSMNKIKNKAPILDGDFVLLLFTQNADDNDIVLAAIEDTQTDQSFLTLKRYKKEMQILQSETTEKGKEYENLILGDGNKIKIMGIAYALAKPIIS